MLKWLFLPHEVDLIVSIALSSHLPDDKLVWALTSNGKFSDRSAYHLAMEMGQMAAKEDRGSMSDGSQLRNSGSGFGGLIFLTKLRFFRGEHAKISYPPKTTLCIGKCYWMGGEKLAGWRWSLRHTCFGTVLWSVRCRQWQSSFQRG